ncbi:MAG: MBL fold metallo-hydrolase [Candidatus Omnitrophica bacterium]|nr:MBL fold metallo-hydrolase [Candidatus Omnitrophota bacterium]
MELFILGSGTGEPSLKRSSSSILIKYNKIRILLDIGPGTLKSFLKLGLDYSDIDFIFLTHFHPDHVLELPYLLFLYKNMKPIRKKPLCIIGPKGLRNFYKGLLISYKDYIKENYPLRFKEISSGYVRFGSFSQSEKSYPICSVRKESPTGFIVRSLPFLHTENSIGFRFIFSNGKVIVYTGDTDYCENLVKLSKNADILLIESSFPDELKVAGHLSPSYVARVATLADVKKVILIHMYPVCENFDIIGMIKREFYGVVLKGSDLMNIKV